MQQQQQQQPPPQQRNMMQQQQQQQSHNSSMNRQLGDSRYGDVSTAQQQQHLRPPTSTGMQH
eukprot:16557-Heterococcus_DN1.PRE.3